MSKIIKFDDKKDEFIQDKKLKEQYDNIKL